MAVLRVDASLPATGGNGLACFNWPRSRDRRDRISGSRRDDSGDVRARQRIVNKLRSGVHGAPLSRVDSFRSAEIALAPFMYTQAIKMPVQKDSNIVKIAVQMTDQVPQLIEFNQKQPLAGIIQVLFDPIALP